MAQLHFTLDHDFFVGLFSEKRLLLSRNPPKVAIIQQNTGQPTTKAPKPPSHTQKFTQCLTNREL